jgi:hypothetical protein
VKAKQSTGKWIQRMTEEPGFKEGSLTATAKAHGMKPMAFAHAVMAGRIKVSAKTKKRCLAAINMQKRRG